MKRYTLPDIAAALDVRPNTWERHRRQLPIPTGLEDDAPYWTPSRIEPWIEQQRAERMSPGPP